MDVEAAEDTFDPEEELISRGVETGSGGDPLVSLRGSKPSRYVTP
jgi:hypothetical protein